MITRENYEVYFIDYLEGNLSDDKIALIENFLDKNPDLKTELTEFSSTPIIEIGEHESIDFSYLKKKERSELTALENLFIGKIEGDLTVSELDELNSHLTKFPEQEKVLASFEMTKLTPQTIIFSDKQSLKRSKSIGFYYYLTSGVAACILALLYFNLTTTGEQITPYVAEKNSYEIELAPIKTQEGDNKIKAESEQLLVEKRIRREKANTFIENPTETGNERANEPILVKKEKEIIPKMEETLEIEMKEKVEPELIAINPPVKEIIENPELERTETKAIKTYAKEKAISFLEEKITGKEDKSQTLFAFAEQKAKEIPVPKFIKIEEQKSNKQQVKTIKIGNLFSIKRKTRI
ncbi:MAG: hypothetical protein ABF242_03840 [Flavobacteriales bacterium]